MKLFMTAFLLISSCFLSACLQMNFGRNGATMNTPKSVCGFHQERLREELQTEFGDGMIDTVRINQMPVFYQNDGDQAWLWDAPEIIIVLANTEFAGDNAQDMRDFVRQRFVAYCITPSALRIGFEEMQPLQSQTTSVDSN